MCKGLYGHLVCVLLCYVVFLEAYYEDRFLDVCALYFLEGGVCRVCNTIYIFADDRGAWVRFDAFFCCVSDPAALGWLCQ